MFGVNCEMLPRNVNFLTDEAGDCGIDKGRRGIGNASRDPIYLTILTSQFFDLVRVTASIACVDIRSLKVNSCLSQPQVPELNVVHHIEQLTKP